MRRAAGISNLFKRETLSGDFLQVNRYLAEELKKLGLWTPEMRDAHQAGRRLDPGHRRRFPKPCATIYRTAWELPMRALIDMAADARRVHRSDPRR